MQNLIGNIFLRFIVLPMGGRAVIEKVMGWAATSFSKSSSSLSSSSASEFMTKGGGEADGVDGLVDKSKGVLASSSSSSKSSSLTSSVDSLTSGCAGLVAGLECFCEPVEQLAGGVGGNKCLKAMGEARWPSRRSLARVF